VPDESDSLCYKTAILIRDKIRLREVDIKCNNCCCIHNATHKHEEGLAHLFLRVSVCLSVVLFPPYLWYALRDIRETFVNNASSDIDEIIGFWGPKVKGQGHSMTKYAKNTSFSQCLPCMYVHSTLLAIGVQMVRGQGHVVFAQG